MDISIGHFVSVRGRPSAFHANFTRILEMCSSDFLDYLGEVADSNLCIEPCESCETFIIQDGEIRALNDTEFHISDLSQTWLSRRTDFPSEEEGLDPPGICDDFSDSLRLYLYAQSPSGMARGHRDIYSKLTEFIDDKGFLAGDPEVIADLIGESGPEVLDVLDIIKCIDPGGIGSRDVKDFLLFQCRESGGDTGIMERIIHDHLDNIAAGELGKVCDELDLSRGSMHKVLERMRSLRPYPTWGMEFTSSNLGPREQAVQPDFVYFPQDGDNYVLQILEPSVRLQMISPLKERGAYGERYGDGAGLDWRDKVKAFEREAAVLYEMAGKRRAIAIAVASFILDSQRAYLSGERDYKEPLTVTQVAGELGHSASTVSRVVKGRIVSTPRGTFPLRELFSPLIRGRDGRPLSRDYIVHQVRGLVEGDDGRQRSDQEIAEILKTKGIDIARRTVNKYRKLQ